ncbi:glycosyltransferase family 4 protein [Salinisphaera sp. LB1]|uniref:glycosyltransferase family 4 protein n=1 Tax=Salinisphaera sp. LB1 TaxID=2183911 RepID=UPI000D7D3465|nr:glycosyltransferase family 4 protein [Salinisphaera sp. LB1]AWN14298.1 Glycosyltransferase [Salinisphaera sp. LB1]
MSGRRLRIAVVTSLYPNSAQPRHGIFVEERLRGLVDTGLVEARVIAPVPWFFSKHPRFGRYAQMASVPRRETRYGIAVEHPRYVVVPKIGMTWVPATMASAVAPCLKRLRVEGFDFDLIDAHYVYPDGVAAARLAARFDRPLTITARGADINQIAAMRTPRRQILQAARRAGGLIAVSQALADGMRQLGLPDDRIHTLRNGVDLSRFSPRDRDRARARLGFTGRVWLCVGHLIERKGMHVALAALSQMPDVMLVLVGDGPEEGALRAQAERLGLSARVRFEGAVAHDDLPDYFSAADVLMHAAGSEGMPNVVLEALACGCAVIATPVGGIPEIMTGPPAGCLMAARDAPAMLDCWRQLELSGVLDEQGRVARRSYAEQFGWAPTTEGQLAIFSRLTGVDLGARDAARPIVGGS